MQKQKPPGVGCINAPIQVYMAKRPDYTLAGALNNLSAIDINIIQEINAACGNGWRKVFNVYAKWVFSLLEGLQIPHSQASWQAYRDNMLLTANGDTALWFSPPEMFAIHSLNVVMGKTYAEQLGLTESIQWLTADFAICNQRNLIVTPYFDYRQLTNEKIGFLNYLIRSELLGHVADDKKVLWLSNLTERNK